ncbi:hypothetical protein HY604_02320 [Candidatus Peregrinibacteria bacterium]|nr:hypothetical protein [Candidatus Peregrinibacteria bacterium]
MAYQFFAFKKSWVFDNPEGSFLHDVVSFIWEFINTHLSWTFPLIIVAVVLAIFYMLFPTLAKASAIQKIARNRNGQQAGLGTGLKYGLMSFLPLFEYHLLIKTFAFFSILIEMSFVLRNLGPVIFKLLLPVFLLFLVISFGLTLFFTFTDFFIVIDGMGVFESMKRSGRLVFMHWKHTFLITILMIIIGIRVIIQAFVVFFIPIIIVLITGYIATVALPVTGLLVGGIVGILSLIVASYLNGIVDVFAYSVWTFTFLELTGEKETSAREVVLKDNINPHHHLGAHKNL